MLGSDSLKITANVAGNVYCGAPNWQVGQLNVQLYEPSVRLYLWLD